MRLIGACEGTGEAQGPGGAPASLQIGPRGLGAGPPLPKPHPVLRPQLTAARPSGVSAASLLAAPGALRARSRLLCPPPACFPLWSSATDTQGYSAVQTLYYECDVVYMPLARGSGLLRRGRVSSYGCRAVSSCAQILGTQDLAGRSRLRSQMFGAGPTHDGARRWALWRAAIAGKKAAAGESDRRSSNARCEAQRCSSAEEPRMPDLKSRSCVLREVLLGSQKHRQRSYWARGWLRGPSGGCLRVHRTIHAAGFCEVELRPRALRAWASGLERNRTR